VAVFPDRIVLKNSTDDQAAIISAIETGGTDEITQGEIVIGRESGSARLYTVDADGAIVMIPGGGGSASTIVSDTPPTTRDDGSALEEGDMWWRSDTGALHVYYSSAWVEVAGGGGGSATLGRGDGGDIDGTTVDSAFVFGVWGGGDFDTTAEDSPVELVVIGMADGGDIT